MTYASGIAAAFAVSSLDKQLHLNDVGVFATGASILQAQACRYLGRLPWVPRNHRSFKKIPGNNLQVIDIDDEFQEGDLCWLETPLNPTGVSR